MRPPLNAGENRPGSPAAPSRRRGFNEAPAERGGKPAKHGNEPGGKRASMRPPLNAGENPRMRRESNLYASASMRPPLNAGENVAGARQGAVRIDASMRPPLNAGENVATAACAAHERPALQ